MTEDEKLYATINAAISKLERFSDTSGLPYVQPKIVYELILPPALEKSMRRKMKKYLRKRNIRVFFHSFRLTLSRIWRKLSITKRIPRL